MTKNDVRKEVLEFLYEISDLTSDLACNYSFDAVEAGICCCNDDELNPAMWDQCKEYLLQLQEDLFTQIYKKIDNGQKFIEDLASENLFEKDFLSDIDYFYYLENLFDETYTASFEELDDTNNMDRILEWMLYLKGTQYFELESIDNHVIEFISECKEKLVGV